MSSTNEIASEAKLDSDTGDVVDIVPELHVSSVSESLSYPESDCTNDSSNGAHRSDKQRSNDTAIEGQSTTGNWNEVIDQGSTANSPKSPIIKSNMISYYVRHIFFIFIVIVTTFGTYQNIPTKQLIPPEVRPFFAANSFVEDWPSGHLFKAQEKVTLSELSFVLFYAPWSGESQFSRKSFDFVAKLFYKEAYFAAINCWHPTGECREQYMKVISWPVLMAYNQNGVAVPYTGQWTEQALTSFVMALIRPLKRIYQTEELLDLILSHDAVVVSFLDMDKHPAFYNIYLQASVKWLERDPHRDVCFAIVSGETRNLFRIDREPSLRMYLWNDTLEYDSQTWKPSLITQWLSSNMHTVSMWASPPGTKSMHLKPFINKGPVLILFNPRNYYDQSNDAYAMLRQVAFEYNNCLNDDWIRDLSRVYSHQRRKDYHRNIQSLNAKCEELFHWNKNDYSNCASMTKKSFASLVNSSKYNADTRPKNAYCVKSASSINDEPSCLYSQSVQNDKLNYVHLESKDSIKSSKIVTSMLNNANDVQSPANVKRIWESIQCKINRFSDVLRSSMFLDPSIEKTAPAASDTFDIITGMACRFNRTLSFLAMDSSIYEIFAERLGIELQDLQMKTAAVILDSENESSYVLDNPITTENLINFVYDFKMNKLERHLRGNTNLNHSYFFSDYRQNDVSNRKSDTKQTHKTLRVPVREQKSITLTELNSKSFEEQVLSTNKTVAVLFYSTQCALCTVFTNTLLYVAKVFQELPNFQLARIDSDKNDLPWQFTMDYVPAFIIFSGQNKLESRKFPSGLQVTVPNVIGFLLANLDRPTRLHAMFLTLKHNKVTSIDSGLVVLVREVSGSISLNLQNWRKLPHRRNVILRRIQALQQFYLALQRVQSVNDLKVLDALVKSIVNLWTSDDT